MSVSSALMSVKEMAKGITYDDPIKTRYVSPVRVCGRDWQWDPDAQLYGLGRELPTVLYCVALSCPLPTHSWTPPRYVLSMSEERHERVRKKHHILVEGDGIPPPIKSFKEMKFPAGTCQGDAVLYHLAPVRLCPSPQALSSGNGEFLCGCWWHLVFREEALLRQDVFSVAQAELKCTTVLPCHPTECSR